MTQSPDNPISIDDVKQQLQSSQSLPAELLEIFAEEADDHLRTIYDGLNRLKNNDSDTSALSDVRRASHTLKGAAGAVNLVAATRLSHRMEDLLDQLADRNEKVTGLQVQLLLTTADQLQNLTTGEFDLESSAAQILELYSSFDDEVDSVPSQTTASAHRADDQTDGQTNGQTNGQTDGRAAVPQTADSQSGVRAGSQQYLRVPLNRLDDLVGLFGELVINRSQFQHRLEDFESRIDDLQNALERLRNANSVEENIHAAGEPGLRGSRQCHGFDQLEFDHFDERSQMTQSFAEADDDAKMMTSEFREVKQSLDQLMRRQKQLNREAHQSLMRIRMVPLSTIVSRLERTVRTVSNKLGKQVELKITGERIELDKTVLDEIIDPLQHLIRNSIDHGIESGTARAAVGKSESACVSLVAFNNGTQVTIQITDDGGGINLEKVRNIAIEKGLIDTNAELSNDQLHRLIFLPGFSTANELTDVSGRGVGMDVVGETIRRLKGTIAVESQSGVGTTFTIQLPTALATTRALIVEAGNDRFAIPMQSIQSVTKLNLKSVTGDETETKIKSSGEEIRLIDLADHFDLPSSVDTQFSQSAPLLEIAAGHRRVAVTVNSILGSHDIVIKPLGNHLQQIRGLIGATIDGEGAVIPVIDASELVDPESATLTRENAKNRTQENRVTAQRSQRMAFVVDDSLSVRRVTENLLINSGWKVVTAKDGVDALELLAELEAAPDIFLSDMEMPRMDGIELIRQIREQDEFQTTPIVMITSRASEKHRHKAFDAGATEYVVKPFVGETLLAMMDGLTDSK